MRGETTTRCKSSRRIDLDIAGAIGLTMIRSTNELQSPPYLPYWKRAKKIEEDKQTTYCRAYFIHWDTISRESSK